MDNNGTYKEQRPLLHEDISDEELLPQFSPRFQRRSNILGIKGRARNKIKGAAAILTRWPDNLSSTVTQWWIILGMLALTAMLVYNTILALSLLPSSFQHKTPLTNEPINEPQTPTVFMPILVQEDEEVNLKYYFPYLNALTEKYTDYNFNLILFLNDTSIKSDLQSAQNKNDEAMRTILSEHKISTRKITRIKVKQLSLTKFLNESPLKRQWNNIPTQFLPFLVKCILIWDIGGVVFDPIILTPKTQNLIYIEKINDILKKYDTSNKSLPNKSENKHSHQETPMKEKNQKSINNIRDIIEALEKDEMNDNFFHNLTEAENVIDDIIERNKRSAKNLKEHNVEQNNNTSFSSKLNETLLRNNNNKVDSNATSINPFHSILDLFLQKDNTQQTPKISINNATRKRKSLTNKMKVKYLDLDQNSIDNLDSEDTVDTYKPMIVSAKGISPKPRKVKSDVILSSDYDNAKLTVDLKGNVIATSTPCHAFIGSVFSDIIHSDEEETVTDFIITELSLFCKGLLSACKGIDVILL